MKDMLISDRLKKTADAIQRQAAQHGAVVVLRDDRGKVAVLPGYDVQMIGVYSDGCKMAWIVDDLIDAGIQR